MERPKFKEFQLPDKILNELYELTGGPDRYKGFMIAYCDEKGTPIIYTSCDSPIVEAGLTKSLQDYVAESQETDFEHIEDQDNT